MAGESSGNTSTEELQRLLKTYLEELEELCHICNITPERNFTKRKQAVKKMSESLMKAHHETHASCQSVSTVHDIIKSGITLIKTATGPVQPCAASSSVLLKYFPLSKFIKHYKEMTQLYSEELKKDLDIPNVLENIIDVQSQVSDIDLPINCKTCAELKDSSEWRLTEPLEISDDAQMKYRLDLGSGCYECMRTGLRVECPGDVQLEYHTCDWERVRHGEEWTPCGTLMDISVVSGELKAVYLPHFLCLGGGNVEGAVKVFHCKDGGYLLEKCELTRFHAKLLDNTFSLRGLLMKIGFPVNYHCQTLIYQTVKSPLTLHVYLIPFDKKLKEAVEREENKKLLIPKPRPQRSLQTNRRCFKLKTLRKKSERNSEITPELLQIMYRLNFFEVFIKSPKEDFHLQLMSETSNEVLWHVNIRKDDYKQITSAVDGRRECYSSNDEERASVCDVLLKYLEELTSENFQLFTWYLTEGVNNFKISRGKLEKKEKCDVVSCMIDHYHVDGAVKFTVLTLRKINQNDLAERLREELDVKDE